jgi:hypothetical protein
MMPAYDATPPASVGPRSSRNLAQTLFDACTSNAVVVRKHPAFRLVSRIVTALLLCWTATCLTNPELCALDQEGLRFTSTNADAAGDSDGTAPLFPAGDEAHVDDCFCCSHHVAPGFVFRVPNTVQPWTLAVVGAVDQPQATQVALFRPPKRSS